MELTPEMQRQAEEALLEYAQVEGFNDHVNEVTQPPHYTYGSIEPAEFMEAIGIAEDFYAGNVIKYVTRYKRKGGLKDVRKALNYCRMLADLLEAQASQRSTAVLDQNLAALAQQAKMAEPFPPTITFKD